MASGPGADPPSWPVIDPPSGSSAGGGVVAITTLLEVIRPDDLLSLSFGLINLTIQGGQLVRAFPGSPATIIVGLPPQHMAEALLSAASDSAGPAVASAAAGGSQLAFTVPDALTTLALDLPTLLGWTSLDAVPPGHPAGTPGQPSGSASILELPYRMLLAVDAARWEHPTAAMVDPTTGTVELWRTRADAPSLHVTWTRDYDLPPPRPPVHPPDPPIPFPDLDWPLDSKQRRAIADKAPALEVDNLTMSTLGATTSLQDAVSGWQHVMSLGRDSYIQTVVYGHLAPFGHPAAIVTVAERVPETATSGQGGDPVPYEGLASSPSAGNTLAPVGTRLVVTSPLVDYTEPDAAAAYSRSGPAMSVPLRKVHLPDLAAAPIAPLPPSGVVQTMQGAALNIRAVAEDLSGASVELSSPMVFIADGAVSADTIYDAASVAAATLGGQKVAFVGVPGPVATVLGQNDGSVLPVDSMSFKLSLDSGPSHPFLPVLHLASVQLPSVSALGGALAAATQISYHPEYLAKGIEQAVNRGTVFASVANSPLLAMAADAAGGLAATQLLVDGLSRDLGPVTGALQLVAGEFDPTKLLSSLENAVFLGGIKLS